MKIHRALNEEASAPDQPGRRLARRAVSGQVLVLFGMSIFVLVGFVALAVDAGFLMSERRQAQSGADAAALAGAVAVQNEETAVVPSSVTSYAVSNGFTASEITPYYPPISGPRAGDPTCVEARIEHNVPEFFVGAFIGDDLWSVGARGVACASPQRQPYALIALLPGGTGVTSEGGGYLTINNGGSMSNADIYLCGTTTYLQANGPIHASEAIDICDNANVEAAHRQIKPNRPTLDDPLLSVPEPTQAECGPDYNSQVTIGPSSPDVTVLTPGDYTQGILAEGGGSKTIVLTSGVYCFGGDFSVASGSSNTKFVYGQDVLLYFYNSAKLVIRGGNTHLIVSHEALTADALTGAPSTVTSALTLGSCLIEACSEEIVIFYSRANCNEMRLEGGNKTNITGIIYAPCSLIHLAGGSGSKITGQILGGSINILGNSRLTINYHEYVAIILPEVYLVE